jgi:hypothetical protein
VRELRTLAWQVFQRGQKHHPGKKLPESPAGCGAILSEILNDILSEILNEILNHERHCDDCPSAG